MAHESEELKHRRALLSQKQNVRRKDLLNQMPPPSHTAQPLFIIVFNILFPRLGFEN